ncbi:class I SAM-dependent methyltransferase [candidate division KSB1 bacterium]|nr:class I SAM-dependent methyltransferase [candidate division KSB1 bacterium]
MVRGQYKIGKQKSQPGSDICYLCGNRGMELIRERLRHNIKRDVLRCKSCGIVYLEPKDDDLEDYYRKDYTKTYTGVIGGRLSSKEHFDMSLPFQQARVNEIKHILSPTMTALDIGCSAGFFLYTLKDYIGDCVGIEFNRDDAYFVEHELNIKVYQDSLEHTGIPFESFDLITAFQVLEHIEDPLNFLATVMKYLKPDGYLCIEVPNIRDPLISIYNIQSYTDFWFREPHIFYYSEETLSMTLERAGFIGNTKTIQNYSFLNHMNWICKNEPQKDFRMGMSKPKLVTSESADETISNELNVWIEKVDEEYKEILTKHGFGENILYIGQKRK